MHESERQPRLSEYRQFQVLYEIHTAQLVMMQRLYDLGMALLSDTNEELANEIFEAHDEGKTMNPQIWIADSDGGSDGESQE